MASRPRTGLRLLTVHAHPDDESSKGAATSAMYAAEGADVLVCTMTGGERGDVLNPALDRPEVWAELTARRQKEMAHAAEILGVRQEFMGFVDSGMPSDSLPDGCFAAQPLTVATEPLVRAIREFRPHVLVTYDDNGGYPHPDHIMTNRVSVAAYAAAGDPDQYPAAGQPWQPLKLYYDRAFSRDYFTAIDKALTDAGLDSPIGEMLAKWDEENGGQPPRNNWPTTTRVPCAEFFPTRRAALLAHETQIDPNAKLFSYPVELEQRVWPTEDYHLAQTEIEAKLPETDLFAGITPDADRAVR